MAILAAAVNQFRGVVVDPEWLPEDAGEFGARLEESLAAWREQGLLAVWLEVPLARTAVVPRAAAAGFRFHHSGEEYVMMALRLVENAFIPPYATHYIGAGGVVLNRQRELLVVCERHRNPGQPPFYKLPGGALHPGEHLENAVIREVLEETGVRTRFDALVCFRHWHGYRYGKSDIYFVCRLHPLSEDITMQEEEIEDCRWLPVDDFLGSEEVSVFNKSIVTAALDSGGVTPTVIPGFEDGTREFFMPKG